MKKSFKYLVVCLFAVIGCFYACGDNDKEIKSVSSAFKNKAKHGEDISIYVDFGISSSQPRFFVYDNKNDSLISKSKCAHGCGGGSTADKPVFSNKPGSNCSSLGEYKLRSVDKMNNIDLPCIRIDGLSKTNSNAASRGVVIHEGPFVADDISIGITIPLSPLISQGCFTISSNTFKLLCDEMAKKKTIYLYAYQSE